MAREDEAVELPCAASGYPIPRYSWTKGGAYVSLSHHGRQLVSGNLRIQHVKQGDAGEYICIAENSLGRRTAKITLRVTCEY